MARDRSVDILEADDEEHHKTDEELLRDLPLAHLPKDQQEAALNLFKRHLPLLSRHSNDLYTTKLIRAHLTLKGCHQSVIQAPIKTCPQLREKATKILDTYIKYGILEYCHKESLVTSAMFIIPKPDGNLRVLFDSRILNSLLLPITAPLQTQEDLFLLMRGAKFLSSVDLSQAFYVIPLDKASRELTAFIDPAGRRLQYTRVPMGMAQSPFLLVELMKRALRGLEKNVQCYMDDVYIFSGDPPPGSTDSPIAHHFRLLNRLFNRLEKCAMKIKPSKVHLLKDSLDVLGYRFERGTHISVPELRVQGILKLQECKTARACKSLIGLTNFFRKMIPAFSAIILPIQRMSNAPRGTYKWTPECDLSLAKLKEAFAERIKLRIPDSTKEFFIFTDASKHTIAGLICQKNQDGDLELCCCISHTLNKSEQNYSIFKLEVMAIYITLLNGQAFLRFAPAIYIYCDSKSLIYLRCCRNSNPMLLRVSVTLALYRLYIRHVAGSLNYLADGISRLTNAEETIQEIEKSRYMTEKEAEALVEALILPERFHTMTPDVVRKLLRGEGLPSPVQKMPKAARRLKTALTADNMTGTTMPRRKIKIPVHYRVKPQMQKFQRRVRHMANMYTMGHEPPLPSEEELPDVAINTFCCLSNAVDMGCDHAGEENPASKMQTIQMDLLTSTIRSGRMTIRHFRMAQDLDQSCMEAKDYMDSNPDSPLYAMKDGILFRILKTGPRIFLPEILLDPLFFQVHFSGMGLHRSMTQMLRDVSSRYYRPRMKQYFKKAARSCFFCYYVKPIKQPPMPVGATQEPKAPKEIWSADILVALPKTKAGNNYLLIATDVYSLFTVLVPLKTRETQEIVEAFRTHLLAIFGPQIRHIHTDPDPSFTAKDFQTFLAENNVAHTRTAVNSPQANGKAETRVAHCKDIIRAQLHASPHKEWDEQLYAIQIAFNFSKTIYGYSPAELEFGMCQSMPSDFLTITKECRDEDAYMEEVRKNVDFITARINNARRLHNKKLRDFHNLRKKAKTFVENQIVYATNYIHRRNNAVQLVQSGPYRIQQVNPSEHTCWITPLDDFDAKPRKLHFTHLRPMQDCPDRAQHMAVPETFDDSIEDIRRQFELESQAHPANIETSAPLQQEQCAAAKLRRSARIQQKTQPPENRDTGIDTMPDALQEV
jgi:transposase InsO family protein